MKFPRVCGRTLDGARVSLPGAFRGDPTLLVVFFRWQQRSLVDPWRSVADQFVARYDEFAYHELLVADWRSRLLVERPRRADSSTTDRHDRTLVLRVNKRQFRRSLGLLGEETVYALLVDGGHVVRQAAGFPSSETVEALSSLLDAWDGARPLDQTSKSTG